MSEKQASVIDTMPAEDAAQKIEVTYGGCRSRLDYDRYINKACTSAKRTVRSAIAPILAIAALAVAALVVVALLLNFFGDRIVNLHKEKYSRFFTDQEEQNEVLVKEDSEEQFGRFAA